MHFLILLPTLPHPPHSNGIALRYYPFLKNLMERKHRITAVVYNLYDYEISDESLTTLGNTGIETITIPKEKDTVLRKGIRLDPVVQLFRKKAIPFERYKLNYQKIKEQIIKAVPSQHFDVGIGVGDLLFSILLKLSKEKKPKKCICDFIDSPYLHFKRRSHLQKGTLTSGFLRIIDSFIFPEWERTLAQSADKALYVSIKDAESVWGKDLPPKIHIMPNGLYAPESTAFKKVKNIASPAFGFVGNMAYKPNVRAALYLIEIWDTILKEIPQANLYVIGRSPAANLIALAEKSDSIHITGTVDNVWEYYSSLDMFLCPLQSGAGLQNKMLEAMWAGVPIVASSIANSGVTAVDGKHLIIADDHSAFVKATVDLWKDHTKRKRIVNDARAWVKDNFNWEHITASFLEKIE
ncbi:MAG: glycosyltransferase [Chitinispirillaceae bacterium]|nr:glycosyltransferase [Chitinispirillaceae bacterium]